MSVMNVTKDNFREQVLNNPKTVLLDFWAPWCGPCRMVAPIVEAIAEDREDIVLGKVNVDEEIELAIRFGVASIPTLVVMEGGEVKAKSIGYAPREEIELAMEFKVASIPTLVVMKNGTVSAKTIGYCPREEIEALLTK